MKSQWFFAPRPSGQPLPVADRDSFRRALLAHFPYRSGSTGCWFTRSDLPRLAALLATEPGNTEAFEALMHAIDAHEEVDCWERWETM